MDGRSRVGLVPRDSESGVAAKDVEADCTELCVVEIVASVDEIWEDVCMAGTEDGGSDDVVDDKVDDGGTEMTGTCVVCGRIVELDEIVDEGGGGGGVEDVVCGGKVKAGGVVLWTIEEDVAVLLCTVG